MDLPNIIPKERFGRKLVICMSMSIEPGTKNACISNLISGYACNHITDEFFVRNRIIAEANLTEKQDPFSPGSEYDDADFYDITLADLRHGYELFSERSNIFDSHKSNPYFIRKEGEWAKCVKISCNGENELKGQRFCDVDVSVKEHSIFRGSRGNDGVSRISTHIGFPLLTKKLEPESSWRDLITPKNAHTIFQNWVAACLMVEMNPKNAKTWGQPDLKAWGAAPSVLVVRENCKDFTSKQIEAFHEFCKSEVAGQAYEARRKDQESRELVIRRYLHGDLFDKFFIKFKEKKIKEGDLSWTDAVNPQGEYLGSLLSSMESVD
jgi:hypothetical protein